MQSDTNHYNLNFGYVPKHLVQLQKCRYYSINFVVINISNYTVYKLEADNLYVCLQLKLQKS